MSRDARMSVIEEKTFPLDFYGGMIPASWPRWRWFNVRKVVTGSVAFQGITPGDIHKITAMYAYISSFPLLHVDVWLSKNKPAGKGDGGIFGKFGCGDTGGIVLPISGLNLPFSPSDVFVLNYWAHNMNRVPYDFHAGYTFHYI